MLAFSTSALAGEYQFISAADLQKKIEANEQGLLLDIQVADEFSAHHIENAVATYAYPVKSDEDKQKLQAVVDQVKASEEPVTIICPRGGGGAKRTYDYLKEQGVDESRLLILEGGQAKWPYQRTVLCKDKIFYGLTVKTAPRHPKVSGRFLFAFRWLTMLFNQKARLL